MQISDETRAAGETHWHAMAAGDVATHWETHPERGLSAAEAGQRLDFFGPNQLPEPARPGPVAIFLSQFTDFMVLVLMGATAVSFFLGEIEDAITILAIIILNACLGFVQEYRAERSLETLRRMAAPYATVVRGSREMRVAARDLVPGDLIVLREGDRVPADSRLLEAHQLRLAEAGLTGESEPVDKSVSPVSEDAALGDRRSMVYQGTSVVRGRGLAVVVATGSRTEMGGIAGMIGEAGREPTPLQVRLARLGVFLVAACGLVVALVVIIGLLRGEPPYLMLMAGISLAVAAIPEGLPAVVTIALALGVQRMIRVNTIIRRLPAVETLGCATVICSDKTGTLTVNRMRLASVWAAGRRLESAGPPGSAGPDGTAGLAVALAAAASDAPMDGGGSGDPTETALVDAAVEYGWEGKVRNWRRERASEIPFDSDRRRMTVEVRDGGTSQLIVKGAPEVLLGRCRRWLGPTGEAPLVPAAMSRIRDAVDAMAARGQRVLAVAQRSLPRAVPLEEAEDDLTLVGLVGLLDPPRPEVKGAVATCRRAGLIPVMITGDHRLTAEAIAGDIGILSAGEDVLTGEDVEGMTDTALAAATDRVRVFARVSPRHKIRIVRAFKARGHVVAMTGDGVNDAPAVKEAHIGVAMGQMGTDVTREAADMVLTDDNFASIVAAVREGRAIYDNIRKFLRYLLACNTGEVLTMFWAGLIGLPLPLLPIQILLVNLVTDGLPALALAVDPASGDVMSRPPRDPGEGVFSRGLGWKILNRGLFIGALTLVTFAGGLHLTGNVVEARTMGLTVLVLSQLVHVFECRSETLPFYKLNPLGNPLLLVSVAASLGVLLSVIYVGPLSSVFKTHPLSGADWTVILALSLVVLLAVAIRALVFPPHRSYRWREGRRVWPR